MAAVAEATVVVVAAAVVDTAVATDIQTGTSMTVADMALIIMPRRKGTP